MWHLFNNWASAGAKKRRLFLIGATALIWAQWTSRNNLVFDHSPMKTYLQVLFCGMYCLRQLLKWFCDTSIGASTRAARCGSFVRGGFGLLVVSSR
jgi:hypothetical protein